MYPSYIRLAVINIGAFHRFGNRYFENLNAEQEVPGTSKRLTLARARKKIQFICIFLGRHRWVDFTQVGSLEAMAW